MDKIGKIVFIIGMILAVLTGILSGSLGEARGIVVAILIIAGLIVGFLNISAKETHGFLVASIALVMIGTANMADLPTVGIYLEAILTYIAVFIAPAALVVAIKVLWSIAQD